MDIDKLLKRLESIDPLRVKGRLTQVIGLVIEGRGIPVAVGGHL
jgi:hypothetical protein